MSRLKPLVKFICWTAAALLAIPLMLIAAYDLVAFQPHRSEIDGLLSSANQEDRHPSESIQRLISVSNPGVPVGARVAPLLLIRLAPKHDGQLRWHARSMLWQTMVRMHLSQEEMMGLYATLVYNGKDQGLNTLALRMYGKPLSRLTEQEAAMVVAFLGAPSMYVNNPDRLIERRDLLLWRLR